MVTEPILYCNALDDGVIVHFSYDLQEREITSTVVAVQNVTIGQLILAWGIPTGYAKSVGAAEVYWGTRSVYLASLPFTPETQVGYIAYSLRPYVTACWHGFTNRDNG